MRKVGDQVLIRGEHEGVILKEPSPQTWLVSWIKGGVKYTTRVSKQEVTSLVLL